MTNKIKPKLRDADVRHISYSFVALLKQYFTNDTYPFQNCITCAHWDKSEICRLYKARPPAEVIAYGCPSYVDFDIIPF